MNRSSILENAVIGATEKQFGSITLRKITARDEILIGRAGGKLLTLATLEKLAAGEASTEITEEITKAVFVCSQDPFRVLQIANAGKDVFETAFFEWLGSVSREELVPACEWILKDAVEIAAASFKTIQERLDESKNVQAPPELHS